MLAQKKDQNDHPTYQHEHYLMNKMVIQERIETWQKAHRPEIIAYQKKYYANNKVEINRKRRAKREAKTVSSIR